MAEQSTVVTVTVAAPLTLEFILDTWDAAGYGIAYWAAAAVVDDTTGGYTVRVQAELVDGLPADAPHARTYRSGGTWALDPAALASACERVMRGDVRVRDDIRTAVSAAVLGNDAGEIDSEIADVLVQVAAWGEVTFG